MTSAATELVAAELAVAEIHRLISTALAEDLRYGPDATTAACVPPGALAVATVSPRGAGTLAGLPVFL
ncbi:MAG: carboxylating nicotinate-nucleotide diphosphorylase, partial [Actinomycetes bacterium]